MRFKMPKTGRAARAVSLSALCLTGCASVPQTRPLTLPPSLFRCLPEPPPPSLTEDIKDSEVALFIKDLAYAGRDCRAQLAEVGHMLELQPEIELADVLVTAPEAAASSKKGRGWRRLFD